MPEQRARLARRTHGQLGESLRATAPSRTNRSHLSLSSPALPRFAATVTGITRDNAANLADLAQIASAATADPEDPILHARAEDANRTLRTYFDTGPEPLRDSGFVGLSQTLLRIISASWFALIQFPEQWRQLRDSPRSADQAFEELFRYTGVIRILWRTATEDIDLNGAFIRRGDHVVLRVFAGSHDPEHFDRPEIVDCARRDRHHFAFGGGGHSCVAANLNRMAAVSDAKAGLYIAAFLQNGMTSHEAESTAAAAGIETRALDRFTLKRRDPKGLLLGFAAFDERSIRAGTMQLAAALNKTDKIGQHRRT